MRLTWDDGPSQWTPAILDLLYDHDVHATFFVIGQHIAGRENILRRMVDEGHRVGNHTWTHPNLTGLTNDAIRFELAYTQAAIQDACGVTVEVWRAPSYRIDDRVTAIAQSLNLEHMGSDVIPDDWMLTDPAEIAERVLRAKPSDIVTLHDGIPPDGGSERCTDSRQPTVDALLLILEAGE